MCSNVSFPMFDREKLPLLVKYEFSLTQYFFEFNILGNFVFVL